MLSFINTSLQEHVESIHHAAEQSTTWRESNLVLIAIIAFTIVSIAIAIIKASPAQRWLFMSVSWIVLGAATVFFLHQKADTEVEEYYNMIEQQEAVWEQVQEDIYTQYDVLDAAPILQKTTANGGYYTTEVSYMTEDETVEPWLHRLAQHDPFHPALVSVILPETHENAIYMLEFSDNGETLVLKTLPDSDDAPPVDDIVR